ncbi:pyridoxamine 5'-phosphate oxidase family protein [Chloroflexota bacterium]
MSIYKKLLKELFSSQYYAVLCSVEKGQPYCNLVAFAATEDLKCLIFVTNRNTRKYRNIVGNNRISLLIDSRSNKPADINEAIAITIIGSAHEETDHKRGFYSIFLKKHPHINQFVDNPDSVLIVITVSKYIIAGFDKVQEIAIN